MDTLENTITSAIKSCNSLRLTVHGLPHDTILSDLLMQLNALSTILELLDENVGGSQDKFAVLQQPVNDCRDISEDLKAEIKQAASLSSLADWASLKCRGKDIAGLRTQLMLLTSTISVHMLSVGLSTGVLRFTSDGLDEFKELINDTTSGLTDRLNILERRLEAAEHRQVDTEVQIQRGAREEEGRDQ